MSYNNQSAHQVTSVIIEYLKKQHPNNHYDVICREENVVVRNRFQPPFKRMPLVVVEMRYLRSGLSVKSFNEGLIPQPELERIVELLC